MLLREDRPTTTLWRGLVALLLVGAALSTVAALTPESLLRESLVLVDHDDSRHELDPGARDAVRVILGAGAAFLAAAAILLIRLRNRALACLSRALEDLRAFCSGLGSPDRSTRRVLAAIFGAGAALRVSWLDMPMRFDEADTYNFFASRNLFSLVTDYTAPNNHILHNIWVHFATGLWGSAPEIIRLPAFLVGLVIMPLAYLFARRFSDERGAVLATALVAVSPPLVRYSAEARGYSMVIACFLALWLVGDRLVERRSLTLWAVFATLTVAGGYTIPVMLYPVAVVSLWMLLAAESARRVSLMAELAACGLASGAAAVALYAPAAARSTWHRLVANEYVAPFGWDRFAEKLQSETENYWAAATLWAPSWWVLLLLAGIATSLASAERRRMATAAICAVSGLMLVQRVVPYARVFTFLMPLLITFAAAGWSRWLAASLRPARARTTALALALALTALLGWQAFRGPLESPTRTMRRYAQAREVAARLIPNFEPDQAVISHPTLSDPIRYYLLRAGFSRRQVLVPRELAEPGRVDPYSQLWVVRGRDWTWPSDSPGPTVGGVFTEPRPAFDSELLEVQTLHRRHVAEK